jgi:Tetratricopeptide repeat
VLRSLGALALLRDDLDEARTCLQAARNIYVQIGRSRGEATALRDLGGLALRRDDLVGAKTHLERARDIYMRIGESVGEANTDFIEALALTQEDMVRAETMFGAL